MWHPGTPPVFLFSFQCPMNPHSHHPEHPDDNGPNKQNRIDADPPYGPAFPAIVRRFRELLAELIARQIAAERSKKPAAGGDDKP
jgi:hypothetical protein